MARVTVEDCIDKIDNRFELVLLVGHRARQISNGADITIERDNDKNPVVALREIASKTLSPADLKEDLIHSLQRHVEVDEPEDGKSGGETIGIPQIDDVRQDASEAAAMPASLAGENEEAPERRAVFENMSEEELLAGIENLVPPEKSEDY